MIKEFQQKALEMTGKRIDIDVTAKSVTIDENKHTATFVMSTARIDRHGDIVDQDSWILEHFAKNAPLFWGHRSNDFPLGKWTKVWLEADPELPGEQMLVGTAEFAVDVHPDIARAWAHVVRGDLNMVSVGFIPHVVEYDEAKDAFVLKSCELMECSLVGIGANRGALVKDADIKDKLIEVKKDIEDNIQETDPSAIRKRNAITLLNKAIRQYTK
ncbi:HK97 family phage prohead protease [Novosphingobium aquae]|uniref:HK97 family phage prohead protease n=1 Tax=Novosphingobium aquae TaxID=3133435 RepID=A0ABU8SBT1_9SPHN